MAAAGHWSSNADIASGSQWRSALNVASRPRSCDGSFLRWSGRGYDKAVFGELFNLVVVADDDKNQYKNQWDNDPEWIDTVRLREECTSLHLYLQNEEE